MCTMTSCPGARSGVGHRELLKSWGRGKTLGASPRRLYYEIVNPREKDRLVCSCAAVLSVAAQSIVALPAVLLLEMF